MYSSTMTTTKPATKESIRAREIALEVLERMNEEHKSEPYEMSREERREIEISMCGVLGVLIDG